MKRILFMHQVSTIGGASYCLLSLVKGIDRKFFKPVVMLCDDGPLAEELYKLGIEVCFFPEMPTIPYNKSVFRISSINAYCKIEAKQKEFSKKLNELKVDMVYLNNMMLYPYLKTAKENGCYTILHVREHWPKSEHHFQMKRAQYYARKYADAVIAINHYSASMFPECSDKITIIHDWFDIDSRYERKPYSELLGEDSTGLKVFLFTGGIGRIKGTQEVISAFSHNVLGSEYRLILMGAGSNYKLITDGLKGFIIRFLMIFGWKPYGYSVCEMIKQDKRIVVIPSTYNMVDIYQQAYCTLSFFTIPHANLALAEAVSLGTVSIAAKTEEALEYSNNGEGAILYDINNEKEFTKKIEYVLDHYAEAKERAMCSSKIVKEMFSVDRNKEKFNQVCKGICNLK